MKRTLNKETVADSRKFRGKVAKRQLDTIKNRDPNYTYRWVVTNRENDSPTDRVEYFEELGWDVVHSADTVGDIRSNVPDNSKEKQRMSPVTKREKGGATKVLMKCHIGQHQANELAKAQRDIAEVQRSRKMVRNTDGVTITEPDVDLNIPE